MGITDAGIPEPVLAVLEALQFREQSTNRLNSLGPEKWPELLDWCDRRQITFVLAAACGGSLPDRAQERISASLQRYSLRFDRLQQQFRSIVDLLDRHGIQFAVLKGITHSPELTPEPLLRAQGDIDLWCPRDAVHRAQSVLTGAGYVPAGNAHSDRHLPPLALPCDWHWRGDIFDPEMPVRVELHHDLWRGESEHIPIAGEEQFRARLQIRNLAGRNVHVLCPQDLLGFAALHLLLHLLHGDLPLQRAWEIARFLHENADNEEFWPLWREYHGRELRSVETVAFQIVSAWFGCRIPECVRQETIDLPDDVRLWLGHLAFSPLKQQRQPNKDELWLHLALIRSFGGRVRVLLRRLLPINASPKRTLSGSRLRRHTATLFPTLLQGLRWRRLRAANHA